MYEQNKLLTIKNTRQSRGYMQILQGETKIVTEFTKSFGPKKIYTHSC